MICVKKYSNETRTVTTATVRKIHNVLRSAFTQAIKWDLIEKNPAAYATVPKHEAKEREIWDAQTIFKAIELCKDPRLKLCLNLAFSCTLRIGELLALTWDCVDISDESIQAGKASISITKELQRVNKKAMKALDSKDIITVFPDQGLHNRTALVLKAPKTPTSIRKVFLPKTVAEMFVAWKMEQDAAIEAIGNEYADFNLVIATPVGLPCESAQIRKALKNLIEENNLPPVVFHSLRHSSITYKLKLNQGDIKSVQGDSGHAQASIVDGVLNAFVRQVEPALKQIHPQHLFNSLRRTAALSARIIRRDIGHPFLPWDDFIHDLKEFLALGFAFPCAVFHVADGLPLHPDAPPLLDNCPINHRYKKSWHLDVKGGEAGACEKKSVKR